MSFKLATNQPKEEEMPSDASFYQKQAEFGLKAFLLFKREQNTKKQ